ncbi:MAG: hypothetical protein ACOYD6_02890 [Limnochordia bacterium]
MNLMGMGSNGRFWRGLFFGSLIGAGVVAMMMDRTSPSMKRMFRRRVRNLSQRVNRARQAMDFGSEGLGSVYRMGRRTMERTFDNMK